MQLVNEREREKEREKKTKQNSKITLLMNRTTHSFFSSYVEFIFTQKYEKTK